jgi:hypothetical protein
MRNSVDVFRKTYEKFGLTQASKMIGIKTYELINYGKISFGPEDAYLTLMDLLRNDFLPKNYKEFKLYYDTMSGVLHWENSPNELTLITVMATPFWDGNKEIPIDIQIIHWLNKEKSESYEDDFSGVIGLGDIKFKNIEELLIWFRDFYLPKTYDFIKSTIKA